VRAPVLVLAIAMSACGSAPPPPVAVAPPRSGPHWLDAADVGFLQGVPFVRVRIGDHGPYWLAVDTGAAHTLIGSSLATELGLALDGSGPSITTPDGSQVPSRAEVTLPDVQVGDAVLTAPHTLVLAGDAVERALNAWRSTDPARGVLGASALAGHVLTIDYHAGTIAIDPRGTPIEGPHAFDAIDDELGCPSVPLRIGELEHRVTIDTGSSEGIFVSEDWEDDLEFSTGPLIVGFAMGASGMMAEHAGRLDGSVELAGYTLDSPIVSLAAVPSVGASFLMAFTFVYDHDAARAALIGRDDMDLHQPPIESIGFGWIYEHGAWQVAGIVPESHATAAGVAAGDELLSIGGHTVEEVAHGLPWDQLTTGDDRAIEVRIRRGTEELTLRVPIAVLIP
jgi:hypothetical protein